MKCNIEESEAKSLIDAVPTYTTEQEWAIAHSFTQYLFVEPLDGQDPYSADYGVKGKKFYCTNCREAFGVSNRHEGPEKALLKKTHKQEATCPRCGAPVTVMTKGRFRSGRSLEESRHIVVFRNTERGLYASAAHATIRYDGNRYGIEEEPTLLINERAIYLFRQGECAMWKKRGGYWFCGGYEPQSWEMQKNVREPFASVGAMGYSAGYDGGYNVFGVDELDASQIRYNGFREYEGGDLQDGDYTHRMLTYLGEYTDRPQLEMVSKLGLSDIVEDLIYRHKTNGRIVNWDANRPDKFLRLNKQETQDFLRLSGKIEELAEYRADRRAGKAFSLRESLEMTRDLGSVTNKQTARTLACKYGIEMRTLHNYLRRMGDKMHRFGGTTLELWKDYLEAAEACGLDLTVETVVMPRDLATQHDVITQQAHYLRNEEKLDIYAKKRLPKLRKKYEFELDGMMIVVPKDDVEIINEGKALQHCVGGYAERHLSGKTDILFLRSVDEPNTPLYTVEVRKNKLIQAHGYKNEEVDEHGRSSPSPFAVCGDFIETWMQWVKDGSQRTPQGKPIVTKKPQKQAENNTDAA